MSMMMVAAARQQVLSRVVSGGVTTVNTVAPVVTGAGYTGLVMSCTTGTWTGAVGGYTYQWQAEGVDISGATNNMYTVTTATEGKPLLCNVTNNGVTQPSTSIHNWVPSDEAGLSFWIDYSDTSSLTLVGSGLSQLNDKSGNSRHATQTISTKRPLNTGTFNGKSAMQFQSAGSYLDIASNTPAVATTFVFIGKSDATAPGSIYFSSPLSKFSWGAEQTISDIIQLNSVLNPPGSVQLYGGESTQSVGSRQAVLDATKSKSIGIISLSSAPNDTPWRISTNQTNSVKFFGVAGEIFVISSTLTLAQKQKIQGYAARKWNFMADLGTHPYDASNGAPLVA